jgi:hypothetical protein
MADASAIASMRRFVGFGLGIDDDAGLLGLGRGFQLGPLLGLDALGLGQGGLGHGAVLHLEHGASASRLRLSPN